MDNVHGSSLYEEEVECRIKIYLRDMISEKGCWQ